MYTWAILENNLVFENKADYGAGIYAVGVTLYNTRVINNQSQGHEGAGLYLEDYGGAYIVDSTIQGNVGYAGQKGAGIYAAAVDTSIVARRSTINGNNGAAQGGGIYSYGVVDLQNSTISGNGAGNGGGIYAETTLAVNYSTIAANYATTQGGGIVNTGAAALMNTVVAGNEADGSIMNNTADCSAAAAVTFAGYSLFGDGTGCWANGRSDQTVDPATVFTMELTPLGDNGGDTQTHALMSSSTAIDAGDDDFCPVTDQRGLNRPQGEHCDSGAFEQISEYWLYLPLIMR